MAKKFLTVLMLSVFVTSGSAFAADIDLGEGYHVPASFDKILITSSDGTAIQNAVDHIQSGGTICLSGDFKLKDTIRLNRNLTIEGYPYGGTATLDCGGKINTGVIKCEGGNKRITLRNLTITGGQRSRGGGVQIIDAKVLMESCDIRNNFAWLGGGGILSLTDTLTLKNCNIHDNKTCALGGGIFIGSSKVVTMTDCKITSNDAALQGGGMIATSSDVRMENCKITGNRSTFSGHGVSITGTKLTAINCDIANNLILSNDKGNLEGIPASPDTNVKFDGNSTYIHDGNKVEGK